MTDLRPSVYRRRPMRMLDVSRVRSSFARVVDSVSGKNEVVVIVRYGKPVAAIVPTMRLSRGERRTFAAAGGSPAAPSPRRRSPA